MSIRNLFRRLLASLELGQIDEPVEAAEAGPSQSAETAVRDPAAVEEMLDYAATALTQIAEGPWRVMNDGAGSQSIINGWNIDDNTMSLDCHVNDATIHFISNSPELVQALLDEISYLRGNTTT